MKLHPDETGEGEHADPKLSRWDFLEGIFFKFLDSGLSR